MPLLPILIIYLSSKCIFVVWYIRCIGAFVQDQGPIGPIGPWAWVIIPVFYEVAILECWNKNAQNESKYKKIAEKQ